MPSKKKKYNARFPAGRIKKIMQTDEEVGKVAQAVPVMISRTLELFVESLLTKSMHITQARNAKTLTPSHMKQSILSESRFDFLKDLVKNVPDPSTQEDNENNAKDTDGVQSKIVDPSQPAYGKKSNDPIPSFYTEQSTSSGRTPVIQYGPSITQTEHYKYNFSKTLDGTQPSDVECKYQVSHVPPEIVSGDTKPSVSQFVPHIYGNQEPANTAYTHANAFQDIKPNVPPLIPIARSSFVPINNETLYIDEDYDN